MLRTLAKYSLIAIAFAAMGAGTAQACTDEDDEDVSVQAPASHEIPLRFVYSREIVIELDRAELAAQGRELLDRIAHEIAMTDVADYCDTLGENPRRYTALVACTQIDRRVEIGFDKK